MDKNQYFYEIYKIANTQRELAEKQQELKTSCKQRIGTGSVISLLTAVSIIAGILTWNISAIVAVLLFLLGGTMGVASTVSFVCAGIESKQVKQMQQQRENLADKKEELIQEMGNLDNPILTQLKIVPAHVRVPKNNKNTQTEQEPEL